MSTPTGRANEAARRRSTSNLAKPEVTAGQIRQLLKEGLTWGDLRARFRRDPKTLKKILKEAGHG